MARYEKPPRPDSELLQEHLAATQTSFSTSYDKDGKLQFLEIESMDDPTLAVLLDDLQKIFPEAF